MTRIVEGVVCVHTTRKKGHSIISSGLFPRGHSYLGHFWYSAFVLLTRFLRVIASILNDAKWGTFFGGETPRLEMPPKMHTNVNVDLDAAICKAVRSHSPVWG